MNKKIEQELIELAIKKFGKEKTLKAFDLIYKWIRGDMFRVKKEDLLPLTVFKPKIMPKALYKGVHSAHVESEWYGDKLHTYYNKEKSGRGKLGDAYQYIAQLYLKKKLAGKLTSWTTNPRVAAKFADAGFILILKNPKPSEIFCSIEMIPKKFKFVGTINNNPFVHSFISQYVPQNESEYILQLPDNVQKNRFFAWETIFRSGYYQGEYSIDTLGLYNYNKPKNKPLGTIYFK